MFLALELTRSWTMRGIACLNQKTANDLDVDVILNQSKTLDRFREIEADAIIAFFLLLFCL